MLTDEIAERIARCLAAQPYYPCVLLVHPQMRRLEEAARELAARNGWRELRVGGELARALAGAAPALRSSAASTALDPLLAALRPGPVICSDLPLLFEPALALDPLALLRLWSRRLALVACWPGSVAGEELAYGTPEHAHWRVWRRTGLDARCVAAL